MINPGDSVVVTTSSGTQLDKRAVSCPDLWPYIRGGMGLRGGGVDRCDGWGPRPRCHAMAYRGCPTT
jgi:hypothetical protein